MNESRNDPALPQQPNTSLPLERETASYHHVNYGGENPNSLQAATWTIGSRIDNFLIEQELGRGGFGTVVLAKDVVTDRHVALKALSSERLGNADAARFLDEARKAAQLEHENIVRVYQVVCQQGVPLYVVMQYVEGADLARVIQSEGPLPPRAAASVIRDVAHALQHAHSRGIVHLDVKPSNILVTRDGTALLTDFGMAIHHDERYRRATGGTPAYMAPEQVEGRQEQFDGRTDLWAVGVVLYEMLTTRRPFTGGKGPEATANLVREICHVDPAPPSQWNPLVPRGFDRICSKCLEKNISDRYASAAEFLEAMQSVESQPGSEDEWSAGPSPSRRRLIAGGCMVIVVVGFAVLMLALKLFDLDDYSRTIRSAFKLFRRR